MDAKTTGSPLSDPAKEPAALRSLLGRTNRDWWPNQLKVDLLHQRQHRREADVGAFHDRAPFGAAFGLENFDHLRLQRRPVLGVHLAVVERVVEPGERVTALVPRSLDRFLERRLDLAPAVAGHGDSRSAGLGLGHLSSRT